MKQSHEFRTREVSNPNGWGEQGWLRPNFIALGLDETEDLTQQPWNLGNVRLMRSNRRRRRASR